MEGTFSMHLLCLFPVDRRVYLLCSHIENATCSEHAFPCHREHSVDWLLQIHDQPLDQRQKAQKGNLQSKKGHFCERWEGSQCTSVIFLMQPRDAEGTHMFIFFMRQNQCQHINLSLRDLFSLQM